MPAPATEFRFVLVRPGEPGNVGAAARAIGSMGFDSLWLVQPAAFPHPDVSIRAAEAADVAAGIKVAETLDQALVDCDVAIACSARRRHNAWPLLSPAQACRRLVDTGGRVALVFGPEASGLTNADLEHCQAQTSIPMGPGRHSLNLSHAVQIYAFELSQTLAPQSTEPVAERPTAHQMQSLIKQWESLAARLDLTPPSKRDQRLAALLQRADLSRADWSLLAGLARRALDQLGGHPQESGPE